MQQEGAQVRRMMGSGRWKGKIEVLQELEDMVYNGEKAAEGTVVYTCGEGSM